MIMKYERIEEMKMKWNKSPGVTEIDQTEKNKRTEIKLIRK